MDTITINTNKTEAIHLRVMSAIAQGERTITEKDEYLQHLLREHPNVCRQVYRYTTTYLLHEEPCGCTATKREAPQDISEGSCCFITQPAGSDCFMCGSEVEKNILETS
jgi:hypothetical protein